MFLVAACPGGNISNFISTLGKANAALSVTLTAIATTVAAFLTPLNFTLWASLYADTQPLLIKFEVNFLEMLKTVFMLLGIPLLLGLTFKYKFPELTKKIIKPIQKLSLVIFIAFILFAFLGNWRNFLEVIHLIFFLVLIHNVVAFATGYSIGQLLKFEKPEDLDLEEFELEMIDAGMEEFEIDESTIYAYADYKDFGTMSQAFDEKGIEIAKADLQRFPTSPVEFSDEQMVDIEKMLDKFEDDEDVQAVFTNIA